MDEARAVLERLDRIERLDRGRADPGVVLGEVRALLAEAEAWARRDGADVDDALESAREALVHAGRPLVDQPA